MGKVDSLMLKAFTVGVHFNAVAVMPWLMGVALAKAAGIEIGVGVAVCAAALINEWLNAIMGDN